ncbi:hypothetical protein O3M35_004124 [Rhynocoris fuscipes]|uniref:Ig-like domain-containing protein n=1 Tax=Rhynocoris fuscipes TaxID=488301 RepID=A0AAW1CIX5_9HEMI
MKLRKLRSTRISNYLQNKLIVHFTNENEIYVIILFVTVRPNKLELSGVGDHVIQGNRVVLQCVVRGARPAANVTWYNGTQELQESSSAESLQVSSSYR